MEKELLKCLMVASMLANGKTINNMDKEFLLFQLEKKKLAFGKME